MTAISKRVFDIICSGCSLLLLSPLFIVIAIWIRLDSNGPAFFMQNRIGRDRKIFRIYKFRTMLNRAPDCIDQHSERVVVVGNDPRITRVGRFLRATSLDELPQVINMLTGDMSIVGPRPIIPEQLEVVPCEYMDRFDVRPGLTGLAQIRGRRNLSWLNQLRADSEYVHNYGFWYDIAIILKTVVVVLKGSGVYGSEVQNWRAYRDSLREQESTDLSSTNDKNDAS